ncbi:MAG: BA14K family protein [Parvibaculaceae bacterium]
MKLRHFILLVLAAMLLVSGTLAVARHAQASGRCLYGSCASGSKERLFGPGPGAVDVTKRGYGSWNDDYNRQNQERYKSGTKAKPFDFGSSDGRGGSLTGARKPTFNDDRPDARSEHVRWCLKRYRSYAVATNTYVTYGGRTRYCDSPFN